MIHITLGAMRYVNPREDQLGRDHVGWDPNMDDEALFRANRGCWVLGERADREQFALLSSQGVVRQAIEIDRLARVSGGRKAIEGRFLEAGHPVHDAYVGKPQPIEPVRNPVTYFESPHAARTCGCDCGAPVTLGWFLPGHDQKALHDRVAKIGTVHQFIEWFDRTFTEDVRSMSSRIESIVPHANDKDACSAHGAAAGCASLTADVVLSDTGSERVEWAVCARWLHENPDATAWLGAHPEAAARLGAF
ncbi:MULTISPECIES: hypothetical protein [Streptomyces]|uniref:hypothetical protein n=1 Tax=Streptomyces TaxID=1883 RepID=UPI0007C8559A|nr:MULTISPECIES: hypothetical protein [unclassified Streptomyces]